MKSIAVTCILCFTFLLGLRMALDSDTNKAASIAYDKGYYLGHEEARVSGEFDLKQSQLQCDTSIAKHGAREVYLVKWIYAQNLITEKEYYEMLEAVRE